MASYPLETILRGSVPGHPQICTCADLIFNWIYPKPVSMASTHWRTHPIPRLIPRSTRSLGIATKRNLSKPRKKIYLPPLTRSKTARLGQKPRHACTETPCKKDFARTADLRRHVSDVHQQSDRHYECNVPTCSRKTRRQDKMREHCQKVHKQSRGEEQFTVCFHQLTEPGFQS